MLRVRRSRFGLVCNPAACSIIDRPPADQYASVQANIFTVAASDPRIWAGVSPGGGHVRALHRPCPESRAVGQAVTAADFPAAARCRNTRSRTNAAESMFWPRNCREINLIPTRFPRGRSNSSWRPLGSVIAERRRRIWPAPAFPPRFFAALRMTDPARISCRALATRFPRHVLDLQPHNWYDVSTEGQWPSRAELRRSGQCR